MEKIKDKIWIISLLILIIPSAIPLLRSDFFHFSDEPHIANLYQMIRAIESGQFPPRWAPDMSYEFGYPLFNFYYPLPFYVGSIFYFFTNSLITSIKLLFLSSLFLSAISMFYFLKEHTSKLASFVGSIIYVYTPYRAVDLYVRGALGEAFSFIFIPLVFLYVTKTAKNSNYLNTTLLGLSIGMMILSHNLAPMIFLPLSFVYGLVVLHKSNRLKNIKSLIAGFLLGLGMSTFWWLPAFLEKDLLQKQTPFNYIDHFPFIKQLIYSQWGYGASNPGIGDDISFQIGLVNIALVVLGIFLLVKNPKIKNRNLLIWSILSLLFMVFLMNIRSGFIWELFSLATYIQFPWRLLMATTFLSAMFIIFINHKNISGKILLIVLGISSIVINMNYFKPSEYFDPTDDYFLNRFFARNPKTDELSDYYKGYSEDYLLLPVWVDERPDELSNSKVIVSDPNLLSIEKFNQVNLVHFITEVKNESEIDENNQLIINNYFFPGWSANINGNPAQINVLKPHGNMAINVTSGNSIVEIKWTETPLRKSANIISLASVVLLIFMVSRHHYQNVKG